MHSPTRFVTTLSIVATLATGCSTLTVRGYSPDASGHDSNCSDSYFAPIVDGAIAGFAAVAAAKSYSYGKADAMSSDPLLSTTGANVEFMATLPLLMSSAFYAMSAVIGGIRIHQCVAGNETADERSTPLRPSQLQASSQPTY